MKTLNLQQQETKYKDLISSFEEDHFLSDPRYYDWRYLLSLNSESKVLVCGKETEKIRDMLSEDCYSVVNFEEITGKGLEESFDLVVDIGCFESDFSFDDRIGKWKAVLKPRGKLFILRENKFGYHKFLKNPFSMIHELTYRQYCKKLNQTGFSRFKGYAPIPNYNRMPLVLLPLESGRALTYFLKNLFSLFETVSPEVRKKYRMEYFTAKIAVFVAVSFKMAGLIRFFLSGFGFILKREAVNA